MITFHTDSDSMEMPSINQEIICKWVEKTAASYQRKCGNIAYIFCNDDRIIEINRKYLQHDYYTDIITFDYSSCNRISGDLFISLDTVRSNSVQQGVDYNEELNRVLIHGVLHLCGINDKGPGEREVMESAENIALALLEEIQRTER